MGKSNFEATGLNVELKTKLDALKYLLSEKDTKKEQSKEGLYPFTKGGKAGWNDVVEFLFNHYESENLGKVTGTRKIQTEILKILHTKKSKHTITTNQLYTKLNCNKNSIKEVMGWYLEEINAHHRNLGWTLAKIADHNKTIIEHKKKVDAKKANK